jgi:hypothetical protein
MEFSLYYRGQLKSNGSVKHKHAIREQIHRQLKQLWNQKPLSDLKDKLLSGQNEIGFIRSLEGFVFVPLVQGRIDLIADIDITLLRPEEPGAIITQAGDIDNRLKTLFDALRMPQKRDEIPGKCMPENTDSPFFCLLEDDNLISSLKVTTDRLLDSVSSPSEVVLLVHVHTKITRATMLNLGLGV